MGTLSPEILVSESYFAGSSCLSSLIDGHTPFSKVSGFHALTQANTASCGLGALSQRGIAHRQTLKSKIPWGKIELLARTD
jgi:hypothetical protein